MNEGPYRKAADVPKDPQPKVKTNWKKGLYEAGDNVFGFMGLMFLGIFWALVFLVFVSWLGESLGPISRGVAVLSVGSFVTFLAFRVVRSLGRQD